MVLAKATPSESSGSAASFVGYASVFDNVDSYGDVVRKGAFAKSIETLSAEGAQPLGVYYAHNMNGSPYGLVGVVKSLEEDDHGLKVTADLFVDSNPEAKFLHEAMQLGVINEMSFAYYVTEGGTTKSGGAEVYEIKGVDLLEVSVCPVGANRQALVHEVKSRLDPQRRRKSDVEVVEEDPAEEPDEKAVDDEKTAVETLAAIREQLVALVDAIDAIDTEDEADEDIADEDSEAAAEDNQKSLALRARAALALARTRAGKES